MSGVKSFIPLFEHEFFPWEGLPYPYEHAKLGIQLAGKGELEKAKHLAHFQQATLDHQKQPILSFFRQEKGYSYSDLEEVNRRFFECLGIEPEIEYSFIDAELGILTRRRSGHTLICLGSGCKSGMGTYLVGEYGILTFGPQLRPIGDCTGFGLAGRGQQIEIHDSLLKYQCRLAAPHNRETGIAWLQDSGYCAMWIESLCALHKDRLHIECCLEGLRSISDFIFTFFVKAPACFVAGSHKLNPRSLDRYQGPPQPIELHEVVLIPEKGFKDMEVIPLAGDASFWGADFMIAFTLDCPRVQFTFDSLR